MVAWNPSFIRREEIAKKFDGPKDNPQGIGISPKTMEKENLDTLELLLDDIKKYDFANDPNYGEAYARIAAPTHELATKCLGEMMRMASERAPETVVFTAQDIVDICEATNETFPEASDDLCRAEELILKKFDAIVELAQQTVNAAEEETVQVIEMANVIKDQSYIDSFRESITETYNNVIKSIPELAASQKPTYEIALACWDLMVNIAKGTTSSYSTSFSAEAVAQLCDVVNARRESANLALSEEALTKVKKEVFDLFIMLGNVQPVLDPAPQPKALKKKPALQQNFISLKKICTNSEAIMACEEVLDSSNHTVDKAKEAKEKAYDELASEIWGVMLDEARDDKKSPLAGEFSAHDIIEICKAKNSDRPLLDPPLKAFDKETIEYVTDKFIYILKTLTAKVPDLRPKPHKSGQKEL